MRKFISALVFGALLIPDYAFTLGMGEIEVNSALNQQLSARIELLSAVPEDAETLIVKLASREEFTRAGLDRPYSLNSLRFKPVVEGGQLYVEVTTPKPVREPFLNFLIEVDWPKGHLLREYTILLDPPVFMGQQPEKSSRPASRPSTAAPAPVQSTAQAGGRPAAASGFRPSTGSATPVPVAAPVQTQSQPVASQPQTYTPAPVQSQSSYSSPSGYRVQAGDTAWSLADSLRPDQSVSVQQMMLAMLRINPEVFINENVNGLKKGYILRIPDYDEITSVSQEEAKAMVNEQNALWREYQQALGVDQPATAIETSDEEPEFTSGFESRGDDARLSIVSAGSGAGAGESKDPTDMTAEELRAELALAKEQLESERVQKEGLHGDVEQLEDKIQQMQGLLEIQDDSMAEIQAVAEESREAPVAEESVAEEITTEEEALSALEELTGEAVPEEAAPEAVKEEMPASEAEAAGEEVFVDEKAVQEKPEEAEAEVAEPARAKPTPFQREEPGLVGSLLGNPLVTGGVALLILVIGAVGYILVKRRRDNAGEEAEATLAADLEQEIESDLEDIADGVDDAAIDEFTDDQEVEESIAKAEAPAEEPGQEFDSEATMILPGAEDTVVTPAAGAVAEEEESDDVIAEADVYLAYGIYQQAEELLEKAIKDNPDKHNYRVKLAETYFAAKNAEGLEKLGTEMKAALGGEETPHWQKVVAMGKELCPDAEIFKQAGEVADLDVDDLMPKSPEPMDFDLGDEAGGEAEVPDLDLDFGEAAPDVPIDETIAIPEPDETAIMDAVEEMEAPAEAVDELEFDIGETDAVEEPAAEADLDTGGEDEFSLDIEASELDIESEEAPAEASDESGEEESVEIDSSELDFDMDLGDEAGAEAPAAEEADLDLSMELEAEPEPEAATSESPASASGDVDLSDLGDVDEINTKLDLAKAYIDMGDNEGARDILDEVVAGGNDQQKKDAQELLGQIG